MVKFFKNFSVILFALGFLLLGLSIFGSVSIWFGIELVKGGVYVLVLGLFMNLLKHDSSKEKNASIKKA